MTRERNSSQHNLILKWMENEPKYLFPHNVDTDEWNRSWANMTEKLNILGSPRTSVQWQKVCLINYGYL